MKQRSITTFSLLGATLIAAGFLAASLALVIALSGCGHVPPRPPPPDPPSDVDAGPGATACERACARADQLGGCDGAGGQDCPEACERYEALGGNLARNPECQAKASTCAQYDACRSGSP